MNFRLEGIIQSNPGLALIFGQVVQGLVQLSFEYLQGYPTAFLGRLLQCLTATLRILFFYVLSELYLLQLVPVTTNFCF